MSRVISIITILYLLCINFSIAQSADEMLFMQKMKLPMADSKAKMAIVYAKSFINRPYKGGTLEVGKTEQLVCNLRDFDCWTFVESVFALTMTKFDANPTYINYNSYLQKLRYRNGEINGYASRLHYFKEWVVRAEQNGYVQDITAKIGGMKANKFIDFMTMNSQLYPNLKNQETYKSIKNAENELNNFAFYYIPKSNVAAIESKIQEGDIIAITSNVQGLDCNHEGYAILQNGRIHLLHASQELKKVVISDEPLVDYLNRIKKHSGIIVARIL